MKKIMLVPMLAAITVLGVSCGYDSASNDNYKNAKASVYDVTKTNMSNDDGYVGGTYSANRVPYYTGMYGNNNAMYGDNYDSYGNNNATYGDNGRVNNAIYENTSSAKTTGQIGQRFLYGYDAGANARNYSTVNNTTGKSNYLDNNYMNTNAKYDNPMYKDMSEVDFNNGLLTYDNNYAGTDTMGTTYSNVNTKALATNVLNSGGIGNSQMRTDMYGTNRNEVVDMNTNKMNYDMNNTYSEVKNATKELVNEVTNDTKEMVNDAKVNTKKALNMPK